MTNVADLEIGCPDALGDPVRAFYGRRPPHYAVYSARKRLAVHFADDAKEAATQRKTLAQLAPLRGEIDGLIDGWRDGSSHSFFGFENSARLKSKADRYERRVGDALVVALELDVATATSTLNAIKLDIINERTAWARFEYLIAAFVMAMAVMFMAFLAAATYPNVDAKEPNEGATLWVAIVLLLFAATAGAAVFLAGRERAHKPPPATETDGPVPVEPGGDVEVTQAPVAQPATPTAVPPPPKHGPSPLLSGLILSLLLLVPVFAVFVAPSFTHGDFNPSPHATAIALWRAAAAGAVGAFFSIAIGIRSRTVLPDLLRTSNVMDAVLRVTIGFIAGAVLMAMLKLNVVSLQIGPEPIRQAGALTVVLIGFFAGFSERLVPDLLEKANVSTGGSAPLPVASRTAWSGAEPNRGVPDEASTDPNAASPPGGTPAVEPDVDPAPEQAAEDACAADVELEDDEITPDEDLPPAAGGVERPTEGGNP
ncbi:MAG TPA: hypothetical protein VF702_03245 [Allosphingosinicella sp.]